MERELLTIGQVGKTVIDVRSLFMIKSEICDEDGTDKNAKDVLKHIPLTRKALHVYG